MTFAEYVRSTRIKAKLGQREMAKKLGVSFRMLCYYESGEREPRPASDFITREGILARLSEIGNGSSTANTTQT